MVNSKIARKKGTTVLFQLQECHRPAHYYPAMFSAGYLIHFDALRSVSIELPTGVGV